MIIKQRFYQTEGSGATQGGDQGTPAPQQTPAGTDIQNQPVERPKKTNISDFLSKQKVINAPGQKTETKTDEQKQTAEKKPVIEGPASKQTKQAEKTAETKPGEKPTGETGQGKGKVKIGDFELEEDEWIEAKKDHDNKSAWQSAHTKKSQIINKFPDDVLNEIVPYVLSQRKLPENIAEELQKIAKLPEKIKYKDADGYDMEIDSKLLLTPELINAVKQHVMVNTFPEYMKVIGEHEKLTKENDDLRKRSDAQTLELGVSSSIEFMQENPEFAVTLNEGEDLAKVLESIYMAGPTHPEYENMRRFMVILKSLQDGTYKSFDEAYSNMYGEKKRKKELAQQTKANQEAGAGEKPAGTPTLTSGQQMINSMKGGKADKLKAINR